MNPWLNLGPKSRAWLGAIGIQTPAQLQAADAFVLYARLKAKDPAVRLNLLYALIGAQEGLSMLKGECNCGAVRFEIDGEPGGIYVCHCSICCRATGAHGIAVLVVPKANLRWLQDQEVIAQWSKPGADWHTWFCRHCGARVPGEKDANTLFVPAGTITEGGEGLARAGTCSPAPRQLGYDWR
ncbi:MAG: GFA family protein [Inhella sp.]